MRVSSYFTPWQASHGNRLCNAGLQPALCVAALLAPLEVFSPEPQNEMSITNLATAAAAASTGTGTAAAPTAAAELEACSIAALSEDDFRLIAQHASAPDVFSLVVTCKHTFWAAWFEQGKAPLARLLVQDAMRRQLLKLLENIGAPQLQHLFPDGAEVDEAGRPQVLLSGSIVVQAALGEQWKKSDVDIFCTWEAAPKVRERLIEKGKLVCSGACDTYFFPPDAEDVSQVDHVEGYAALPQPGHHALNSWHTEDELSPDEFLKQAIEHGQEQVDTQGIHAGLPILTSPSAWGCQVVPLAAAFRTTIGSSVKPSSSSSLARRRRTTRATCCSRSTYASARPLSTARASISHSRTRR